MDLDIEKYSPHRDKMKLLDSVIKIDNEIAITKSIVSDKWPMYYGDSVNSILLVEIIAQTTSFAHGWRKRHLTDDGGRGWLVGIKNTVFHVDTVPLGTVLITTAVNQNSYSDIYSVINGTIKVDDKIICEAVIQVFKPE